MCWQVHAPRERRRTHQYLTLSIGKEILNESTILAGHHRMVNRETKWKEVSYVTVLDVVRFFSQNFPYSRVGLDKLSDRLLLDGHITNELGRFRRLLARVDEDQCLVFTSLFEHLLVTDFIHDLVPLDGLLLRDTNKLLLECARTVRRIEVEKTLRLVNTEESSDVLVVW